MIDTWAARRSDKVYNKRWYEIRSKIGSGESPEAKEELAKTANETANADANASMRKAIRAASTVLGIGTALGTAAVKAGKLMLSNVGTMTSNQAYQNTVDNATMISGKILGLGLSVGAGVAISGGLGAAVAAVGWTATEALETANRAMNIAKNNQIEIEDANRTRDRLGYIQAGYSR